LRNRPVTPREFSDANVDRTPSVSTAGQAGRLRFVAGFGAHDFASTSTLAACASAAFWLAPAIDVRRRGDLICLANRLSQSGQAVKALAHVDGAQAS
jgi:hypothetical protein